MARLIKSARAQLAWLHDTIMSAAAFALALYLRVGGDSFGYYADLYLAEGVVIFTVIAAVVYAASGMYRGIWRYASLDDMAAITRAVTLAILIFLPFMFLLNRLEGFPRSHPFILWFVLIAMLAGPRILYRIMKDRSLNAVFIRERGNQVPVLLIGAADGAELFLRSLRQRSAPPYRVVGILSEKEGRVGRRIHGVEVLGVLEDFEAVYQKLKRKNNAPRRAIVTRDDVSPVRLRDVLEASEKLGMTLARTASPGALQSGPVDRLELKPIAIEDLLGRSQRVLDRNAMTALVRDKRVLLTGAGGSIGSELARQISDLSPAHLVLVDSSEFNLYEIDLELAGRQPNLQRQALLANVRDADLMARIFAGNTPDIVFHAAALKHVPLMEANPDQAILTNVLGTRIIADLCRSRGVETMVQISTDKAVNPTNVMGASKRLAEAYCQALDVQDDPADTGRCRIVTVRFGNVLGSTGSVVPLFQKQLAAGGPITVTDPEVTRYFMTIREAVELVLMASAIGAGKTTPAPKDAATAFNGKIFVLDMGEPVKIIDLARQMIRLSGKRPDLDVKIDIVGLRPGEKLYEELLHDAEDLVDSGHDGLFLASPRVAEASRLAAAIDQLVASAEAGNTLKTLNLLAQLVPEFDQTNSKPLKPHPIAAE